MTDSTRRLTIVLATAFALAIAVVPGPVADAAPGDPPWKEILGPAEGEVPGPRDGDVEWMTDVGAAFDLARREKRPLFVTMRCLPCKQCADFDKDVLEGGTELDPLLRRFVTVRITSVRDVDLGVFPMAGWQDLDLSWWGWFLTPERQVVAVFGGRDHVSDTTRISVPALVSTMERVLAHVNDPRRAEWKIDREPEIAAGEAMTPRNLPGFDAWAREGWDGKPRKILTDADACLHCHEVADVLREPAVRAKTLDKERDLTPWPLPENVGIELDRDHGLKVSAVTPGSAAAAIGLEAGDVLGAAGGRRLFGQADLRGVLHRGPRDAGEIGLVWTRGSGEASEVHRGTLEVEAGWRETVLDWRMSISQGNVGAGPGFFPLRSPHRNRHRVPEGKMAVEPYMGPSSRSVAAKAGVKKSDCLVAVDGESPPIHGRAFLVWFRKRYDPGDIVTLRLIARDGKERDVSYRLGSGE